MPLAHERAGRRDGKVRNPHVRRLVDGAARFESHSNQNQPALGIGVYERSFSDADMVTIESRIDPGSFASLPDHLGKVLPGERWKRIRLTVDGQKVEKLVGASLPVDPRPKSPWICSTALSRPRFDIPGVPFSSSWRMR